MTRKLAKWASKRGQTAEIRPSNAGWGKIIPTAAQFGYHRYGFEGNLGNVGSGQESVRVTSFRIKSNAQERPSAKIPNRMTSAAPVRVHQVNFRGALDKLVFLFSKC